MVVTSFRTLMRPNRQMERRRPHNSIEVARTKIRRRAERQAGVIARNQALRYGLPQHVLERHRRRGALKRVLPGVDALAGTPETGEQRLWAAALWMEDAEGVFSHNTAAKLWRLPEIPSDNIDILLTRWRSSPAPWIRVHTTKILGRTERTLIGRHPVTTIDRTLFDLGTCVDEEALEISLDAALLRSPRLLAVLERSLKETDGRGRRGRACLRRLLRVRGTGPPCATPLETLSARFLRAFRFPPPQRQYVITHEGAFLARADFAYPERRLAIEAQSLQWHANRAGWQSDLDRSNALVEAEWQMFHITANRLRNDPDRLAEDLWSVYRSRDPRLLKP
jgi:very-short-patch-repair endonuclease